MYVFATNVTNIDRRIDLTQSGDWAGILCQAVIFLSGL